MNGSAGETAFEEFGEDFHAHHRRFGGERAYHMFEPAYRYGWNLAVSEKYGSRPWAEIRSEVFLLWEQHNPGTWQAYRDAIMYGWDLRQALDEVDSAG